MTAWDSLAERFAAAHGKPHPPLAAIASLAAWVRDKTPCYPVTSLDRAYARIERFAAAEGFEEIPARDEVAGMWQRAYARWCRLRNKVASEG